MRCPACGFELTPTAKFCSECGEPVARAQAAPPPSGALPSPESGAAQAQGERRQLTVLFSDLVGSTAMASRLDPEDWREVVSSYQAEVASVVERFGGYVAQYLGDGVVVYFGYPTAAEDDALRATRAGLGILEALAKLEPTLARHDVKLSARVGIHTGTVVVGEVGSSARRERLALGDTTNLTARLQEVAAPGTVVVSATTFRIVRGHFATEDRGVHTLKGITRPVSVYRILKPVRVRSTTRTGTDEALPPLVGRKAELLALLSAWEHARSGRGRAVILSGEAGIGKSRLAHALRQAIQAEPHTWLDCRGSAHTIDTALYPIVTLQEDALDLGAFTEPQQKTAQLERSLSQLDLPASLHLPALAALHGLPVPARYPQKELTPEAQRRRTLDSILEWILGLSRVQPVIALIEDLHWVDPTTLELLGNLVGRMGQQRILLLMTERPGFEAPWPPSAEVITLPLSRLGHEDCAALVSSLKAASDLPEDVLGEIVARSDGVPLYLEEITRTVLETEAHGGNRVGGRPVVPSTLQDSLMARLDQLGPVKDTAQLCASLGREFPFGVLREASPLPEPELRTALDRLVAAGLLTRRGDPPLYAFKHALIQEQAYESLLKTTRQAHHRKIAEVLSLSFPQTASVQPELLAHHYDAGGLFEPALGYWLQAGQRSIAHSANVEASRQLRRALEALSKLPETRERDQQELLVLTMRGVALIAASGYAAPEVEQAFARARRICTDLGDMPHLHPVLFGLFLYYMVRADGRAASELVDQLEVTGEKIGDAEYVLEAHSARAALCYWEGKFDEASEHILKARLLYDPAKHAHHPFVYGQDPLAYGYCYGALTAWFLGYPDQARDSARKALDLALRTNHPLTFAGILSFAADLEYHLRDARALTDLATRMSAVTKEQALPLWGGWAQSMLGSASALDGNPRDGIPQILAGMAAFRATGARMNTGYLLSRLAAAYLASGEIDEGLARVEEALALRETAFDCYYDAELHRLRGELLLQKSEAREEAERAFERALQVARAQNAKSLELRAAMSLGRSMAERGRRTDAVELLSPVYGWFTEGLDTRDLVDARELLDAWRS